MSNFEPILTEQPFDFVVCYQIHHELIKGEIRTNTYHKVNILTFHAKGDFPIVGLVEKQDGEHAMQWTLTGKLDTRENVTTDGDLVLLVEKKGGKS